MAEATGEDGRTLLGEARRAAIAEMLRSTGSISVAEVQEHLGVSPMTARRDLAELARRGVAQRTHGGAVIPSISVHEDSFAHRLDANADAKRALAAAAARLVGPRDAVYLDSSSTSYYVADQLIKLGIELTLLTNSLPVIRLIAVQAPAGVELVAVGGVLRKLTQSFVGPYAIRTVHGHFTDRAFLSVTALTEDGVMVDVDPLEAEVKRSMVAHAHEAFLLIDHSKLVGRGLNAITPVADISMMLTHGCGAAELRKLRRFGVPVKPTAREGRKP